jgi:hypothetical protein
MAILLLLFGDVDVPCSSAEKLVFNYPLDLLTAKSFLAFKGFYSLKAGCSLNEA